jgi:hypothetical protein
MRVLVLGGAGNFGARIVRALAGDPALQLLAASRRGMAVPGAEGVTPIRLDLWNDEFTRRLAQATPDVVVHCVGPFQGQDYRVARAALQAGAHYVDLADGRDFVAGFSAALDAQARAAGRAAISGASTLPALSSAVIDELSKDMDQIDTLEVVIAPGQKAPRGAATLEAVFSYLGRPFPGWRDGRWRPIHGWMDLRRVTLDIGTRWAAACDVPDLALFPKRYAPVREVRFHAALELGVQHFILWFLAGVRRVGLPVPVTKWAPALDRHARWFDRWGGAWGGMSVRVCGRRRDQPLERTWQLSVPAKNGPEIPTLAAILLVQRLARSNVVPVGASPCIDYLCLSDFSDPFGRWDIRTRVVEKLL